MLTCSHPHTHTLIPKLTLMLTLTPTLTSILTLTHKLTVTLAYIHTYVYTYAEPVDRNGQPITFSRSIPAADPTLAAIEFVCVYVCVCVCVI